VSQLLQWLDGRLALPGGGDRLAAGRHRSLAAAAQWSYELLEEDERRVFRLLSVFPAPFTLEAAGAVAGPGAALVVLRLVECSLLVPPRPGVDGRSRYAMLETLRGYGAGLLAEAGEQGDAEAALARYAVRVAEEAAAGLRTTTGELDAARWLDAEDAMMGPVLAWAVEHDLDAAARLVTALSLWWGLRGRLAGQEPLLRELTGRAEPGSDGWCTAQHLLAEAAFDTADVPQVLQRCAAVIDVLGDLGHRRPVPEAAASSRRALAMARELGYPLGQVRAMTGLIIGAVYDGHLDEAAELARQAGQIPDIPGGTARVCGYLLAGVLAVAGYLAAAEQACTATLTRARDAGDLNILGDLLRIMAELDLRAGRTGDAAAHLREAAQFSLQTGAWLMTLNVLEDCGHLCAATGRPRRRGHSVGRLGYVQSATRARARRRGNAAPRRRPAQRPGGARPGPGQRGRTARRSDEHGHHSRVRPDADRPAPAADGGDGQARQAHPPETGAGHPGRPGPHRCADRRVAVHLHPHRPLAPGPDPGQNRLPPPRRPDPAGPGRGPGLARPPGRAPAGSPTPAAAVARKGVIRPLPRPGRENLPPGPEQPARSGQELIMFAYLPRRGAHLHPAARLRRLIAALLADHPHRDRRGSGRGHRRGIPGPRPGWPPVRLRHRMTPPRGHAGYQPALNHGRGPGPACGPRESWPACRPGARTPGSAATSRQPPNGTRPRRTAVILSPFG
jgi:hypothetical protein